MVLGARDCGGREMTRFFSTHLNYDAEMVDLESQNC